MALLKDFSVTPNLFDTASQLKNAYIRVDSISGTKSRVNIFVGMYKNIDNSFLQAHTLTFVFHPNLEGKNFIAQAYEHLKTLPEFAGATDC
jgi:hypothetical protein